MSTSLKLQTAQAHLIAVRVGPCSRQRWPLGSELVRTLLSTLVVVPKVTLHICMLLYVLQDVSGAAEVDNYEDCGNLTNAFGPFDYRTVERSQLKLVEDFHFTPKVERLVEGQSGYLGSDISYTLRVFPNHHRALLSMANLATRLKKEKPDHSTYSMRCWFDRAERMAPDDGQVKAILGYYLSRFGDKRGAAVAFQSAIDAGSANANVYYNLGLVQLDLKDYDNALKSAKKAYSLGAELPGLRNKLKQLGKWTD